jgi:hypothetical protein
MELQWTTQLRTPEDFLKALTLCGVDLSECTLEKCRKAEIICDNIARVMAGRCCGFDQLINDIVQGCSLSSSDPCSTSQKIMHLFEQSQNAYISPDGRRFWPDPNSDRPENRSSRFSGYQITPSTALNAKPSESSIVTMGSCFMNEINKLLASDRLLMVMPESGCSSPHIFPANWGTTFNPLSAQYSLEWFFGERNRPEMLWRSSHNGTDCLYDVFREDVSFSSIEEFRANRGQHIANSKYLLQNCKAFVCAFSMTETWLTNDGNNYPLARAPWRANPLTARPYNLTYIEVVSAISSISRILHKYNKGCRIFVGVDPVPLHATHSHKNSIIADSNAKATLLAGIMTAIQESSVGNLHYVPFYESIHYCTTDPWSSDERHLNDNAILKAYKELISLID